MSGVPDEAIAVPAQCTWQSGVICITEALPPPCVSPHGGMTVPPDLPGIAPSSTARNTFACILLLSTVVDACPPPSTGTCWCGAPCDLFAAPPSPGEGLG